MALCRRSFPLAVAGHQGCVPRDARAFEAGSTAGGKGHS